MRDHDDDDAVDFGVVILGNPLACKTESNKRVVTCLKAAVMQQCNEKTGVETCGHTDTIWYQQAAS